MPHSRPSYALGSTAVARVHPQLLDQALSNERPQNQAMSLLQVANLGPSLSLYPGVSHTWRESSNCDPPSLIYHSPVSFLTLLATWSRGLACESVTRRQYWQHARPVQERDRMTLPPELASCRRCRQLQPCHDIPFAHCPSPWPVRVTECLIDVAAID